MKYLKMLGFVAAASLVLVVLGASSASAAVFCQKSETPCPKGFDYPATTKFQASLSIISSVEFSEPGGGTVAACTGSTLEGTTANTGGAGMQVEIKFTTVTLTGCTSTITVSQPGGIKVTSAAANRGTATGFGTKVKVTVFGSTCLYGPSSEPDVGTIKPGGPGVLEAAGLWKKLEGSFFCPAEVVWSGLYEITAPSPIFVMATSA
jgi:hypothetical protein